MNAIWSQNVPPGIFTVPLGRVEKGKFGKGDCGKGEKKWRLWFTSFEQLGMVAHLAELHHQVHEAGHTEAGDPVAKTESSKKFLHLEVLLESSVEKGKNNHEAENGHGIVEEDSLGFFTTQT